MITAAKLTRTALELGVPADVFSETASNLRAIEIRIVRAFLDSPFPSELTGPQDKQVEEVQASYEKFHAEHIQALLED